MVADDEGGIGGAAEDLSFGSDAAARGGVGPGVDDLERVNRGGALVADLVDGAAVSVAENFELLDVAGGYGVTAGCGGGEFGGGVGCCGGSGGREREARAAFGGFGEGEAEIGVAAVANEGHGGYGGGWWWLFRVWRKECEAYEGFYMGECGRESVGVIMGRKEGGYGGSGVRCMNHW